MQSVPKQASKVHKKTNKYENIFFIFFPLIRLYQNLESTAKYIKKKQSTSIYLPLNYLTQLKFILAITLYTSIPDIFLIYPHLIHLPFFTLFYQLLKYSKQEKLFLKLFKSIHLAGSLSISKRI